MTQGRISADEGSGADYVRFWPAGQAVKGEFHCAECGYGVAVYRTLPRCPMCGGEAWEQAAWSPFRRALDAHRH
jgi:rubrerythrin